MFELHVFVPVTDNAGKKFTSADHKAFEAFVIERFGGVSLFPGTVAGAWIDAGVTYLDRCRVYGIGVRSLVQGGKIGEVIDFAKKHYRQEAIYVRYLGVAEIL